MNCRTITHPSNPLPEHVTGAGLHRVSTGKGLHLPQLVDGFDALLFPEPCQEDEDTIHCPGAGIAAASLWISGLEFDLRLVERISGRWAVSFGLSPRLHVLHNDGQNIPTENWVWLMSDPSAALEASW